MIAVFLFPILAFILLAVGVVEWRKGVKKGYFQKSKAPKKNCGNCTNCKCDNK